MFQFPWCAPVHPMDSGGGTGPRRTGGLPHSGIPGSTLAYSSPRLIGVRPVLHRLLAPRHPPCALTCFSSHTREDASLLLPISNFQGAIEGIPSKLKSVFDPSISFIFLTPLSLHRKEVIHPHLPVGIPCYDFTPIICTTFGGWLPKGLPHRLRVLQT